MSLAIALNNALSGLQTNEAAIQIIAGNVANAQTEGYTRKSALPISRALDGTGAGVELGAIGRVVDERLLTDLRRALGDLGSVRIQDAYFSQILDQFGTLANNRSLTATITDLETALQGVATSPESTAQRLDAVNAAQALATQLNAMSAEIQSLRADADQEIVTKIQVVNGELQRVAELNSRIESGRALGEATGELEDARDQALNTLSELIDIRTFTRATGEIVVTLPDGRVVADKNAKLLTHTGPSAFSADISFPGSGVGPILVGGADVTSAIASGELGGLIQARDQILPDLQAQIDSLTATLRDQLNAVHNAGAGLPPANSLNGTRVFADPATDTITLTAGVRIAVVDASGAFTAYTDLAAGTYTVQGIETLIDANLAGFASASSGPGGPLSLSANDTAHGIALVDLGVQTVTHTDGVTTYSGFSNYFGLNDLFVTPGRVQGDATAGLASRVQVRADILNNPVRLSRGVLDSGLSPLPVVGDTAIAAGDASSVQALADIFLAPQNFATAGGLPSIATTLGGYGSEILSENAVSAQQAAKSLAFRASLTDELSYRNQSVSGVNIDEELRNLVLYENAYGATARIIQVVDDLFEILTNLVR